MTTSKRTDWSDVATAAKEHAGNWQRFECFVWYRRHDLTDAANWLIWYTSHRDAGVLSQSNDAVIRRRLEPFSGGNDPDLVFEQHSSWIVGHVDGFSIRVFGPDGTITDAFREFCRLNERLDDYPILDEQDYGDRDYAATLENYACEMWEQRDALPEGWEAEVHSWFRGNDQDSHTENRDDQGGWAPREAITEALTDLGLLPRIVVVKCGVDSI